MQHAGTLPPGAATPSPSKAKPKKKRLRHTIWWYFKWLFNFCALALFCATVAAVAVGKGLFDEMGKLVPDVRFMQARNKAEATRVYAADGSLLATFKLEQRDYVQLNTLMVKKVWKGKTYLRPGNLINATTSIEDSRFFTHPGIDAKRVTKATYLYVVKHSKEQGGSTITEQLAKRLYLTPEKTLQRRIKTMLLALQLERRLTKEEILELYLNEIAYGNFSLGCEAASQTYFGKSASKLTIAEAAMLAGLPQLPSKLDPFRYFKRAQDRQQIVLREMLKYQKITYAQYQEAKKDTDVAREIAAQRKKIYAARRVRQHWKSPYFVSYVLQYLQKQYGWSDEFLSKSGLKIYTTLDTKMQRDAEQILTAQLDRLPTRYDRKRKHEQYLQGALVSIDPWSGNVLAMVGGRDYYDAAHNGEFNRATQARRQPGSTFKPYVYAAAMEAGYTPNSMVNDSAIAICGDGLCPPGKFKKGHEIKNYTLRHDGPMTFQQAIGQSNNVAATRVLLKMGIQTVIEKAHLMGISSSMPPVGTLALGVGEVTPLEHTSAYGVFATGGLRADATPIVRVENPNGQVLIEAPRPAIGARVLSPNAAKNMHNMLRYVVTSGTGKAAAIPGVDVIGKTGTTSANKDVWFMGASPQLVTGVWIGADQPSELAHGSAGGKWCAPVWRGFMTRAIETYNTHHPAQRMVEDARATDLQLLRAQQFKRIMRVKICDESGVLANSACPNTHVVVFSAGEDGGPPTRICDIHKPQTAPERPLADDAPKPQPGDLNYSGDGASDDSANPDDTPVDGAPPGDDLDPAQNDGSNVPAPDTSADAANTDSSRDTAPAEQPRRRRGRSDRSNRDENRVPTTIPPRADTTRSPDSGDSSPYDPDDPVIVDGQQRVEADNPMDGER